MALQTDFAPTPTTLPASITAPPTFQFTPPPECYDPGNNWIVTTSCYLDVRPSILYPDWLTCSISHFGAPNWYDSLCNVPVQRTDYYDAPKTTQDGVVSYQSGCPVGFTATTTSSQPGWDTWSYDGSFDATGYEVGCCPSQYHFELNTGGTDPRQLTQTEHDGRVYPLFIYPLPGCAATSISELSGKEIAFNTWSNTMAWDKRQGPGTTTWDYEHGTMFAHRVSFTYTVFHGTHTCYEQCSNWFTYYYPDGVGTPGPAWPSTTPEANPTPEPQPEPQPEPEPEPQPEPSPITTSPGPSADNSSHSSWPEETDTSVDESLDSSTSVPPTPTVPTDGSPNDTSSPSQALLGGSEGSLVPERLVVLALGVTLAILSWEV